MTQSDTTLHDLCKGFGALLSRSKQPSFPEEASKLNDRGNLPLHAACSFQATPEVVQALLRAYPGGSSQPNGAGNLPIHQAAMWQAPLETVELLLSRYPEGATVRNQYGSLPLHMAASNQAAPETVRLLIDSYPDALHLQNDDGMTPLDLALADEGASEAIIAMLEGRPPPPEMTRRQQAEKLDERAAALERKLSTLGDAGGRQNRDLTETLLAVRRLADRFPHALYSAGIDPNELEHGLSEHMMEQDDKRGGHSSSGGAEAIILDFVKRRSQPVIRDSRGGPMAVQSIRTSAVNPPVPRDRIEDLLASVVGLDHIKSQVRGLRRTTEICDLRESLIPHNPTSRQAAIFAASLQEQTRPRASHMVFAGNPGTGKTAVARLLAKAYHELGLLRKPKFLEVERMDLVARDKRTTISKTREVLDEARGGILFIDEAYTLGMVSRRSNRADTAQDAIAELVASMDESSRTGGASDENAPLIILAGFPMEMQSFLVNQPELRTRFPLTFEFPDYSCLELAQIFADLSHAKGFDLDSNLSISDIAKLLDKETTASWRTEHNGRLSEMLLTGARTEVRKRMRAAQFEDVDDVDPQLIMREDIENVMHEDFK